MIYVIATSKQHLMWEFKIWLIVFRLNTTDRSTCRNHLCFRGDSCIDLWDILLWVPAAISWWGKALESLSLPRILASPLSTVYSISTNSSKRYLPAQPVDTAPISWPRHQPGKEKSSHTACTSSHTNTHPPDPDAQSPEWNRIKRARQQDRRAPEFTRDYSLIKRHTIRETAMERNALHMIWLAKGETRVQIHLRKKWRSHLVEMKS